MKFQMLGAVALVAAFLSGCSEEQPTEKPPRPLRTVTVQPQDIGETIEQTGEVRPRSETAMSFRINGQLEFRAENGASVKAGDILAKLDRRASENGVLTARADLATAKAELELAHLNAERGRSLFEKNVGSKAQMEQADATLSTAEAKLAAAEAGLANAEETLSYTELRAAYDGVISAVGSNAGQVVGAGQMVVTLISDAERDAVFDIPVQFMQMNGYDPVVKVALISEPSIAAEGKIREVAPSADPTTRTYRVKVELSAAGKDMPFGAAVRGAVVLSPQKIISVPSSAITQDQNGSAVFVVDRATNTVKVRGVKVERYTGSSVLVSDGLGAGEVVATAGVSKLRDGEKVVVRNGGAQ